MDIKNKVNKGLEKLKMYDIMLANWYAKNSVILSDTDVKNDSIHIGYNCVESSNTITKYFIISGFPMYISNNLVSDIRMTCKAKNVKINFYNYCQPHKIRWESQEMINRMKVWREAIENSNRSTSVFDYRDTFNINSVKDAIMHSTLYFNKAELEHKRTLAKVTFMVEFKCAKNDYDIDNFIKSIKDFKTYCINNDIKVKELKTNLLDWMTALGLFSLKEVKEVGKFMCKRVVTDDVLARFNSYRQGMLGETGVCMGIDLLSGGPVLKVFKEDPDEPENWLIAAQTGGGKSYYVKTLLTYLLADGKVVTVIDYEGDEYTNLAAYLKAGNPEDVKVISMGKGSSVYFDPIEIAELTGDEEVDVDLKETAQSYIEAIFRLVVAGLDRPLDIYEKLVVSTALNNVYEGAGVTNDSKTWHKSRGLRIKMVYDEIKRLRDDKYFVDNVDLEMYKHKAAVRIIDSSSIYFEEDGSKAGTFAQPMSINDLHQAKFIVFQFGMKGAVASQTDPIVLALKQLSVANISIQISNHCKYVRKCFNVKVWEEFQRWGEIKGSDEIIVNAMTGGRKRGDINILITNNINSLIDEENKVSATLTQNFQGMCIGGIYDKEIREKFCAKFGLKEIDSLLLRIGKANNSKIARRKRKGVGSRVEDRFKHAFCFISGSQQAVVKVRLPNSIAESKIFRTGVDVQPKKEKVSS